MNVVYKWSDNRRNLHFIFGDEFKGEYITYFPMEDKTLKDIEDLVHSTLAYIAEMLYLRNK